MALAAGFPGLGVIAGSRRGRCVDSTTKDSREDVAPADGCVVGVAEPGWTAVLGLAVAGLILASRIVSLRANPTPWLDEAMLGLNLLTIHWSQVLQPLPLFEQAAPLGCVLLGKAVSALFWRDFVVAMRICAAVASLAAAAIYYRALRTARPRAESALVVGLLMLSPALVFYSIEMKHYIFDVLSTVAVIGVGANALRAGADRKSMVAFTMVSSLAMLFSFTAVFVIAGFGSALLLVTAAGRGRSIPRVAAITLAGVALVGVEAGIYFFYAKPSITLQLQAYADNYVAGHLAFPPLTDAQLEAWRRMIWWLRTAFHAALPRPLHILFVGVCAIGWLRGVLSPSRSTRFLALGAALTTAGMIVAAMQGVFTPQAERHLLFPAPLTALVLVWGLRMVVDAAAFVLPKSIRPAAASIGLALPVLAFCFQGLLLSPNVEREPVRPMLDRVIREGGWPSETWVYFFAQPTLDLLSYPKVPAYLGRISHVSSADRWTHSAEDSAQRYLARFEQAVAGRPRLFILFDHAKAAPVARMVAAAERAVGPCELLDRRAGNRGETALYRCIRTGADASLPR